MPPPASDSPPAAAATPHNGDEQPEIATATDERYARQASLRPLVAVAFPVLGAAVMVGGIFTGSSGRVYAAVAGLLGVALAASVQRLARPSRGYPLILGGLFGIGLVMLLPTGVLAVVHVRALVDHAVASGAASRPPVPLLPGWQAVIGWLMGTAGFVAAWLAVMLDRPALGVVAPLPLAAIAAISVPASAQAPSGVAVLVLFAISLGLLSSSETVGEDGERPPLAFEVRKAIRSIPVIAAVCGLLIVALRADFLFPHPAIDPAHEAQRPRAVPLSEVQDRVLFSVKSSISGPWRVGSLDVYDGLDWRLPPFADSKLRRVPTDGIIDHDLQPAVKADFRIRELTGAVLPGLPNTTGILASGPRLAYDARNGNIRTAEGQVTPNLRYSVVAAALPSVQDLDLVTLPIPDPIRPFTQIGAPPPAVVDLIAHAPTTSKWRAFDFLRTYVLDNVVANGPGVPTSIDAARVQDMLAGSREGSPFEIVAAQAMLARWIGVPSRIGYGFDGGVAAGDELEVHPSNGATFVEVYFAGYKWLPVIGVPRRAKAKAGNTAQKTDPNVQPSDDISIQVFAFQATEPGSSTLATVRRILAIALPVGLAGGAAYLLWPALAKRRARVRGAAVHPVHPHRMTASRWPTASGATSRPTSASITPATPRFRFFATSPPTRSTVNSPGS